MAKQITTLTITEIPSWVWNTEEIDDVALNDAYWTQKYAGVQKSLINIEVPV